MPLNYSLTSTRHYSPRFIITAGALFGLICVIFSTFLGVHTQWLGVNFEPHENGLLVSRVCATGPAHERLHVGDVVTAIAALDGDPFYLQARDLMEDPYDLLQYREFNDFFTHQTAIYSHLKQAASVLILADGRKVTLHTVDHRPLSNLPLLFWLQLACGFISLLIGISVYAFRQDDIAARCLALSSIGLMVIITAAAMYSSRELAINGELFYRLTLLNQYGTVVFISLGSAVLWYSPRRLSPLPMASMLFALYSLFALLHTIGAWDTLNIGIRFPIFLFVGFIIIFSLLSWRETRGRPASRAALKWLLYAWFTGILLFLGLRLIPVTLGMGSLIPQAAAWLVLVFIYVGITLGIIRYRLFNLDRWVLRAWFWIFSGLLIVAIDIALISLLNLNKTLSTAIALAVAGWVYFPLRQALWVRFVPGMRRIDFENLFPEILEMTLSPAQDGELFKQWIDMLQRAYKPLEIKRVTEDNVTAGASVKILRNGLDLYLPALPSGSALQLSGAEHADRLFNTNDVRFASAVWGLFNQAVQFRRALEQGADNERQRIARDLHDDVAARLLTLVHRADDAGHEKLARQALSALRDTIYSLGTQSPHPLQDMLTDMHHELQQRLEAVDIKLECDLTGVTNKTQINPRQHINLQRIMQELVSNVIHHANADTLNIKVVVKDNVLFIDACDNGDGSNIVDWTLGKGLNNIRNRINELKGSVDWRQGNNGGCCAHLDFPL